MQDDDIKITPEVAEALLEYISMEDCKAKNIITVLAKSKLERYFEYLDAYAKTLTVTQEYALQKIIANK